MGYMVCFRYIIVNTLHKGDNSHSNNNNSNKQIKANRLPVAYLGGSKRSTSIAASTLNLCARWGWVVSATPRLLDPRYRAPACTGVWVGRMTGLDVVHFECRTARPAVQTRDDDDDDEYAPLPLACIVR